jgi:thiamine-phosphate pyrophosphorylase
MESVMPIRTLRVIDANCNRIGEGLRFLEDVARFVLNDASLCQQLKATRHSVIKNISKLGIKLISERDSESDVGAESKSGSQHQELSSLVIANAKRVEEGLRVIEEIAKLPEISNMLESSEFQKARFNLYTLEQKLLSRILRQQKITRLTGLYVIIDTQVLGTKDEIDVADKAIQGGAKVLQLRDKRYEKGKLLDIAQKLKDLCHKSNTLFIINDHLDIALAADADGLHIGQEDLPLTVARKALPIDKIIGCSAINLRQAQKAEAEGADYIAVGAIFPTPTKTDITVVSTETLLQIKQKVSIPVVAIGGINKDNINEVMATGADSAAVISAILNQDNIEEATREMISKIEQKRKDNQKSRKYRRKNTP